MVIKQPAEGRLLTYYKYLNYLTRSALNKHAPSQVKGLEREMPPA